MASSHWSGQIKKKSINELINEQINTNIRLHFVFLVFLHVNAEDNDFKFAFSFFLLLKKQNLRDEAVSEH